MPVYGGLELQFLEQVQLIPLALPLENPLVDAHLVHVHEIYSVFVLLDSLPVQPIRS